jgi:hypothetical protein
MVKASNRSLYGKFLQTAIVSGNANNRNVSKSGGSAEARRAAARKMMPACGNMQMEMIMNMRPIGHVGGNEHFGDIGEYGHLLP